MTAWLRNVGDEDDDCWVPCAKDDPGATLFVAASIEAVESAFVEVMLGVRNAPNEWKKLAKNFAERLLAHRIQNRHSEAK